MPRVKKIDYDDELSKIDVQIIKCEQTLGGLKENRKLVVKQKEEAELSILYDYIKQTGKTVSEFILQVSPTQSDLVGEKQ
jgi:hypothetical protein